MTDAASTELRGLLRLAVPLGLVQLGYQLMGLVDTAFAGRIDDVSLGATGIGASVFFAMSVVGVGVAMGLDPLAAQAFGANEPRRARHMLWQGVYTAVLMTVPLTVVVVLGTENLERFGIVPELAATTRAYIYARLPSLLPLLLSVTLRSYLQAAHATRPILWATVWTNLVNAGANYVLIYGDAGLTRIGLPAVGLDAYGVRGLGWATVIAMTAQAATLAYAVHRVTPGAGEQRVRALAWPIIGRIVRVGAPIGLHLLTEVGIFSAVQVLIGGMGVVATASHQVAISLASMTFSFCLGIGAATSVQVGRAIGREDTGATRRAGLLGVAMGGVFMTMPALAMWIAPQLLARIITPDPVVVEAGAVLLRIAGAFQIVDGVQTVAGGALRGAGVTGFTFGAHLVAHWVIGLPLGATLAFGLEMGPAGLWWGLTAGLTVVSVVLLGKYLVLSSRPIARLAV